MIEDRVPDHLVLSRNELGLHAMAPRFFPGDKVAVLFKGKRGASTRAAGTVSMVNRMYRTLPKDPDKILVETSYQVEYRPKNYLHGNKISIPMLVSVSGDNITALPPGETL